MPSPAEPKFVEAAQLELAFLVAEYGFCLVDAQDEVVRFESPRVVVKATFFAGDRGQLDLTAAPVDTTDPYAQFVLSGMVGRSSAIRLLRLAAEKLRANEAALLGDVSYYQRLADERRREAEAWTAFYAGKGPQPTGKLP
jgi:hypothetical protein